jgi:hypothetical protein
MTGSGRLIELAMPDNVPEFRLGVKFDLFFGLFDSILVIDPVLTYN